jgi:hypothetical protein
MDEIIHLQEDSYTPINSSDNYKFSSEFQNITKKETQNDLINEKNFLQIFNISQKEKDDTNIDLINKKGKKRRRKKYNDSERKYQCPDCDKNYLSEPALFTHRRIKHGFISDIDQKKIEDKQIDIYKNYLIKYFNFFNDPYREKLNDEINLEIVKNNFKQIFIQCKSFIFQNIKVIEDYSFYQLVINNWDKKTYDFPNECLSFNDKAISVFNSPPLDPLFFLYLKEFSSKTNNNYFWFINKFIILFREGINLIKKDNVKEEYKTAKEKVYTQLFSAEGISDSFNDFFLEFMNPKKFFGLNESELIKIAQHFCFWLFQHRYTHSFLSLF